MAKKHAFVVSNPELYKGYIDRAVDKTKEYIDTELEVIRLTQETGVAKVLLRQLPGRVIRVVRDIEDFYLSKLPEDYRKRYFSIVSDNLRERKKPYSTCMDTFLNNIGTSLEALANSILELPK